jgi:hypothetical protein
MMDQSEQRKPVEELTEEELERIERERAVAERRASVQARVLREAGGDEPVQG